MTQENFKKLAESCGGTYKWWNQTTYCKQVPKQHQEGVCAAASITFLYSTFLRGHDFGSKVTVEGLAKSYKDYLEAHKSFQKKIEETHDKEDDELEVLNFGFHYDEPTSVFPLIKQHKDVKDFWTFRGQWNEKLKKYESTDSKKYAKRLKKWVKEGNKKVMDRQDPSHPPLTFRKLIRWRGVESLVKLQEVESEGSEKEDMPHERAEEMMKKASNGQLKIVRRALFMSGKKSLSAERLMPILSYHGCYYVHVPGHAMAAYVDRRTQKYKYFEPNAGIATFKSAEDLMKFTAAWLAEEYKDTMSVSFYHFL